MTLTNNLFERKAAIVIQKGRDDSLFSSSSCILKWGRRSVAVKVLPHVANSGFRG